MKQKHIIIAVFTCVLMFSLIVVLATWTQNTLSRDEARFDLDKNGELSTSEKELMITGDADRGCQRHPIQ